MLNLLVKGLVAQFYSFYSSWGLNFSAGYFMCNKNYVLLTNGFV
ncbi:hypothetical protein QTH27_00105 [Clostridium perfringens]|nr:hypothetical protein [Clostridium perfringens]MDM0485687.1 hypothetical protein [Clostridium perfringens]